MTKIAESLEAVYIYIYRNFFVLKKKEGRIRVYETK